MRLQLILRPLLGLSLLAGAAVAETVTITDNRLACAVDGVIGYSVMQPPTTATTTPVTAQQALDGINLYSQILWIIAAETSCAISFQDIQTSVNERVLATLQGFDGLAASGQTSAQINAQTVEDVQACIAALTPADLAHIPLDFATRLPCGWVQG